MQYIKGIGAYSCKDRSAVTMGKFDGLHRGHQKLLKQVKQYAEAEDIRSIVCSFDMLPLRERMHMPGKVLMTKEERADHLEGEVDFLVDCPFTEQFSEMEAEDFIRDILAHTFHAAYVVVGTDFHFGYGKRGDAAMLAKYQETYGYRLAVIEKERYGGRIISSSYIREALREGDMALAETLLGYPYSVNGIVEHGKQRGRAFGFPTINVSPPGEKLLPPDGVYLGQVYLDGRWYDSIENVGVNPTVEESGRRSVKGHLLGYCSQDAYEKKVKIRIRQFCRPEEKFVDIDDMKLQIKKDIRYAEQFFAREDPFAATKRKGLQDGTSVVY